VIAMIARLVEQKGVDITWKAAQEFLKGDVQLVVLGEGDHDYHLKLSRLRELYPLKFGLKIGFDEVLSHRIEAGADLYLMPSLFEPSGLNQLYSLRYGTPPIVRATGGLSDTIVEASDANLEAGTASGFRFQAYTPQALQSTDYARTRHVPLATRTLPAPDALLHAPGLVVGAQRPYL